MATLLTFVTTKGTRRHCNKTCYDSKSGHTHCKCICKGNNHGRGLEQAQKLTKKHGARWLKSEQLKERTVQTTIFDEETK